MSENIFEFAAEKSSKGSKVALVTVTETYGSSPASVGQIMAVTKDGDTAGTVGGGASEYRLVQQALSALESGEKVFNFSFDHAENGMVCGGGMSGFGNVVGSGMQLYIFGGGHVAQCLAPIALLTGFSVGIIEDRPEFEKDFSNVAYIVSNPDDYHRKIQISDGEYAVICTRGHSQDYEALKFCLNKKLQYVGMIGSEKKVQSVFRKLKEDNFSEEQLKTVYAPIGLDIASEIPAEIAVSILAEILMIKNGGKPTNMRNN